MIEVPASSFVGNIWRGRAGVRWRWKRSIVGFANPQQSDGELCIGWDTLEQGVTQLKKLLPMREVVI
jgi:hypothetical protein